MAVINTPERKLVKRTYVQQSDLNWGAFTYDVRFLGRQVSQVASDFNKKAYVVKYLIRVGGQKYPKNI